MTITIHAHHMSPYVHHVLNACKEVGVPYELVNIDVHGGATKTEEYKEKYHPFGQIPVLFDGDFRLFETRAMARYVVRKYGVNSTLLPKPGDVEKEAMFEQAASIEQFDWHPYASVVAVETFFRPLMKTPIDEKRKEEYLVKLKNSMRGYERILAKQKYLAGDDVTLADLFHLPIGTLITKGGVDLLVGSEFPNVARWWKGISTRPAWIETQAELEKSKRESA